MTRLSQRFLSQVEFDAVRSEVADVLFDVVRRLCRQWISSSIVILDPLAREPWAMFDFSRHRAQLDATVDAEMRRSERLARVHPDHVRWVLAGVLASFAIDLPGIGPVSLARCL